jgi:hypothetical protein
VPTGIRAETKREFAAAGAPVFTIRERQLSPLLDSFAAALPYCRIGYWRHVGTFAAFANQRRLLVIGRCNCRALPTADWPRRIPRMVRHASPKPQKSIVSASKAVGIR